MKNGGYFFAGLLLASAFIACADVSSRLRRYTYPPDFNLFGVNSPQLAAQW
jgi:hypothetical protein